MSWSGAAITRYRRAGQPKEIIRKTYSSLKKRERERHAYTVMAGSGLTPALLGSGIEHVGAALIGDARFDLGKIIWVDGVFEDRGAIACFMRAWREHAHLDVHYEQVIFYGHFHALAAIDWVVRQSSHDSQVFTRSADFLRRAFNVLQSERYF